MPLLLLSKKELMAIASLINSEIHNIERQQISDNNFAQAAYSLQRLHDHRLLLRKVEYRLGYREL